MPHKHEGLVLALSCSRDAISSLQVEWLSDVSIIPEGVAGPDVRRCAGAAEYVSAARRRIVERAAAVTAYAPVRIVKAGGEESRWTCPARNIHGSGALQLR